MIKLNENDIKHVIKTVLKEYVNNNMISLKNYFSQSEYSKKQWLPDEYYYFFEDFLEETGNEFIMPKYVIRHEYGTDDNLETEDEEVDMFEYINNPEVITHIERNNIELYNEFADYLYNKIKNNTLPIDPSEYPAWAYFNDKPELIKNQWLIHFTNDADGIAENGFKYGVDEVDKLGLTTHLGEFDKKYGGYNFSYLLRDFPRYASSRYPFGGFKYGKEAVVFKASGFRLYHYGDEEPQTIFYGNTATNIIPITSGENLKYGIYNIKNRRLIFENDEMENMVKWIVKNYTQYKNVLHK